jgi:hypothetical protein
VPTGNHVALVLREECAATLDDALEERAVLGWVRALEATWRNHDGGSPEFDRSLVDRRVHPLRSSRHRTHAGRDQIRHELATELG